MFSLTGQDLEDQHVERAANHVAGCTAHAPSSRKASSVETHTRLEWLEGQHQSRGGAEKNVRRGEQPKTFLKTPNTRAQTKSTLGPILCVLGLPRLACCSPRLRVSGFSVYPCGRSLLSASPVAFVPNQTQSRDP